MTRLWRALARFMGDPSHRSTRLLRLFPPHGLFQPEAHTALDRYPKVFRFAADALGREAPLRLLSFGCSTGEELLTLRGYFPRARIVGLDISRHNVRMSRKAASGDPGIVVRRASSAADEPVAAYDAIFAMAVFRHADLGSPAIASSERLIRFERFEAEAGKLARRLRPGGLLFITHSNFRFRDAAAAADFDVVLRDESLELGEPSRLFDRQDQLMPGETYEDIGFRKRPS